MTAPILMAALCSFWGCDKDEDHLSEAVLASANTLNFEAERAAEKIITIYADADWVTARRTTPARPPSSSRDGLLQAAHRCSSRRTETNTAM